MAKSSRSEDNPEGFVKNYQLEMIDTKLDGAVRTLDSVEKRMSEMVTLAQTRPTVSQVEALIQASELRSQSSLNNAMEKQDLKYAPIVGNNKWLLRLLVGSGITILVSLIIVIVGVAGKS